MSNEQRAPAFPARIRDDEGVVWPAIGLTKLEYAAVHIMAHLIERAPGGNVNCSEYASASVGAARALFAELDKDQ